jgi:hypothetical protein
MIAGITAILLPHLLKPYQILSNFLLACCFVAVFLLFSAEKQQANSNPTATKQQPGENDVASPCLKSGVIAYLCCYR